MQEIASPLVEFVFLSLCLAWAPGFIGALALDRRTVRALYTSGLRQAPWAPPAWIFAPVWFILYSLLGISYWLLRRDQVDWSDSIAASIVYYVLLASLTPWTWLYFRWRLIGLAVLNIVITLGLSVAACVLFWIQADSVWPGILTIPLPVWLLFASSLNVYTYFH